MRTFRLLKADEIECRINEIARNGNSLTLLLYKTARTDAALLDETFGAHKWQNDYKVLNDKMYCGIGIKEDDEWVWKYNTGTESNMDGQKGEASDAMKRAGFVWGIGTELYSAPRIKVKNGDADIKEYNGKFRCYDEFSVRSIMYNEHQDISFLSIWNNSKGCECFRWMATSTGSAAPQSPAQSNSSMRFFCTDCGKEIKTTTSRSSGVTRTAEYIASQTEQIYGRCLCMNCANKLSAAGVGNAN